MKPPYCISILAEPKVRDNPHNYGKRRLMECNKIMTPVKGQHLVWICAVGHKRYYPFSQREVVEFTTNFSITSISSIVVIKNGKVVRTKKTLRVR